ncbi:MAG: hypothetical protein V3R89_07760 [Thermoanaerobaculia bacterium]
MGPAGAEGAAAEPPRAERSCGRILSFLLDPPVIRGILHHLDRKTAAAEARAPPLPPERLAS